MATTRGERLRSAREKRFKSARLAAKALGVAISTYGAHERAEAPGGRDYGPNEAKRYGRWFRVAPEWLLTGRGPPPPGEPYEPLPFRVRVVGYVGAGAEGVGGLDSVGHRLPPFGCGPPRAGSARAPDRGGDN